MPKRRGFTLVELMIVIAIIAIIAAIAIPNLLEARKSGNESSAIGTLRSVNNAQGLYRQRDDDGNGTSDYADTLEMLQCFNAECVDEEPCSEFCATNLAYCEDLCTNHGQVGICTVLCNDGHTQYCDTSDPDSLCDPDMPVTPALSPGYTFAIQGTESPPSAAYRAIAVPEHAATGNRVFSVEENGRLLAAVGRVPVEGDEVIDPGSGPGSCGAGCDQPAPVAIPSQDELDALDAALRDRSSQLVADLLALGDGETLDGAAERLRDPQFVPEVFGELDATGGSLGFDSILDADLLGVARALAAGGTSAGDDADVETLLTAYRTDLETLLRLDLDPPQPAISTAGLAGDALQFLLGPSAVPLLGALGGTLLGAALAVTGARRLRRDG